MITGKGNVFMKEKVETTARITMGLIFFTMGLNGFFQFIQMQSSKEEAMAFINALSKAQYFWPLEKFLETVCGFLLIINRFVPLAIEILAPIIVNIMLFHIFLDLGGIHLALIVFVCEIVMVQKYWKSHYSKLFVPKVGA